MKQIHYVANVVIKRVETGTYEGTGRGDDRSTRKVGDVISLVVRGVDLEDLKEQLKNHLLLAKDDINVPLDEYEGKVAR